MVCRPLEARVAELDPAPDRKGLPVLADAESRPERALEPHPCFFGDARLGVKGIEGAEAQLRFGRQVKGRSGAELGRSRDIDRADLRQEDPGREAVEPARAGVVAPGGRQPERVLAPGDVDRFPERFALADVEAGVEREALRRRPGAVDLEDGVEAFAGHRERRIVELRPGKRYCRRESELVAGGRGPSGGERKVERAAEVPAGETLRDERSGDRPERGDVEPPALEPELGDGLLPRAVPAGDQEGGETGQPGFERRQDASPSGQVQGSLGGKAGVIEGDPLALGDIECQSG